MLKTLGAYVKEYKRASIATPFFMILEVLMEMLIPYLLSSLIDNGVEKGDMGYILMVGGCMVVIAMVGLFAGIMGGVYGAKASTGFAKNLRKGMFDNIQTYAFSNIDKFINRQNASLFFANLADCEDFFNLLRHIGTHPRILLPKGGGCAGHDIGLGGKIKHGDIVPVVSKSYGALRGNIKELTGCRQPGPLV